MFDKNNRANNISLENNEDCNTGETSLEVGAILKRLKKSLHIKKDVELAELLEVLPSTISTWKKRNSINYALLIELCELHKIDLNYLFFGTPTKNVAAKISRTPLISKDMVHEYTVGTLENNLSDLPSYNFPFVKEGTSRAFQSISGNMQPLVEENSLVICEEAQPHEIQENEVLVLVSRKKGFFLNRVKKIDRKCLLLTNDNPHYKKNDLQLDMEHIDEAWSVKGILSPNMQKRFEPNYLQNEKTNGEIHKALIKKEHELVASSLEMAHLKNEIGNVLKSVDSKNSNGIKLKLKALSGDNGAWDYFVKKFVGVHPGFIQKLQKHHHNLSKNDIDFCSLILLGLSNKKIGALLNISHESVITKKYRLRKKMNFSTKENSLEEYLKGFEKDYIDFP